MLLADMIDKVSFLNNIPSIGSINARQAGRQAGRQLGSIVSNAFLQTDDVGVREQQRQPIFPATVRSFARSACRCRPAGRYARLQYNGEGEGRRSITILPYIAQRNVRTTGEVYSKPASWQVVKTDRPTDHRPELGICSRHPEGEKFWPVASVGR